MLIMEEPLLETLILFLILVVEEIIVVRVVVQARLLKMKTKSDKKSTSMVAWKGKSLSYLHQKSSMIHLISNQKWFLETCDPLLVFYILMKLFFLLGWNPKWKRMLYQL